jgi:hypothetical protein
VAALLSSPFIIVGDLGFLAGLALIAFGTFHFGAQAGSPIFVGIMLVGFSSVLLLPKLADLEPPEPPVQPPLSPGGGSGLPPAQESALSRIQDPDGYVIMVTHT